jgi:hypothetical protein
VGALAIAIRCGLKRGSSGLLLASMFTLGTALGFASGPDPERIQATFAQDGSAIGVTLVIYDFTSTSAMQVLSQAFEDGHDTGLATALSNTKAVGICSIAGDPNFNIAFIQMVPTPTGRKIVFITNRLHRPDEDKPGTEPESFDLLVGQFDMNDTDNTKSTGFLYPASKLVIDGQGKLHYDLAGSPRPLVGVLDSKWATDLAERQAHDAVSPPASQ